MIRNFNKGHMYPKLQQLMVGRVTAAEVLRFSYRDYSSAQQLQKLEQAEQLDLESRYRTAEVRANTVQQSDCAHRPTCASLVQLMRLVQTHSAYIISNGPMHKD